MVRWLLFVAGTAAVLSRLGSAAPTLLARQTNSSAYNADPQYAGSGGLGSSSLNGAQADEPAPAVNTTDIGDYGLAYGQSQTGNSSGISFDFSSVSKPQPIRGDTGTTLASTLFNLALEKQNPDSFAPPSTDNGDTLQAKWDMDLSHNRLTSGGWARQQNTMQLPAATEMAGVQMRLEAGAYRELHWHTAAEMGWVLNGSVTVGAVAPDGTASYDTLQEKDIWLFPSGVPHSIQALANGTEFLLIFDNGSFSEDSTFLLTDWINHTPREVLSKEFQVPEETFNQVREMPYIFPGTVPNRTQSVEDPYGPSPNAFTYHFSEADYLETPGGQIRFVDSTVFPMSQTLALAEVQIEPGAMRSMHWHPNSDEWNIFLQGQARITVFAAQENARTFNYQAGDVGYIPISDGHYIENTGNETVVMLEVLRSAKFEDVELQQWLALTPSLTVAETLSIPVSVVEQFKKKKQYITAPWNGVLNQPIDPTNATTNEINAGISEPSDRGKGHVIGTAQSP